jgi:hypothetical protein
MLVSIECQKFIQKVVTFNAGLNVVLGDNNGSNSIGKSTFLMIVDFMFGGDTYIDNGADIINHVGHHEIIAEFLFSGKKRMFARNTESKDNVFEISKKGRLKISIEKYRAILLKFYFPNSKKTSFRQLVSTYSRVWGKGNDDVKNPLLGFSKQPNKDAVVLLLKLFGKYEELEDFEHKIVKDETAKKVLTQAFTHKYIEKIGKKEYERNIEVLSEKQKEIDLIQEKLKLYAINVKEIAGKNIRKKKEEKDHLLEIKIKLEDRKSRILNAIEKRDFFNKKEIDKLVLFFPEINLRAIEQVESFHIGITKILARQLKSEVSEIDDELLELNKCINQIDVELSAELHDIENPSQIVDRVVDITNEITRIRFGNQFFEESKNLENRLESNKQELEDRRERILGSLQEVINSEIRSTNAKIHGVDKKAPVLAFQKGSYSYTIQDDTGTGKAYIDLLLLDLAILLLSNLPVVIHDSMLFKNIEISTTERLFGFYSSISKQIFVSIDELLKYSTSFQKLVTSKAVLRLDNSRLLFGIDWRKESNEKIDSMQGNGEKASI